MKFSDVLVLIDTVSNAEAYQAIARYARGHNWRLTIEDRYAPPFGWSGDGLLSMMIDEPNMVRFVRGVRRRGIPVVDLQEASVLRDLPRVTTDFRAAGRLAAEHFAERGFQHAAWLSVEWTQMHELMLQGFAGRWPGNPVERFVWPELAPSSRVNDRRELGNAIMRFLQRAPKPLALLTFNAYNASLALNICLNNGIRVPDDVAVIAGSDGRSILCDCQEIGLSGIAFDNAKAADLGARTLDALMHGKRPRKLRTLLPPQELVIRGSSDIQTSGDPFIRDVFRLVHEHLSQPYGVAEIATALGLSRPTLDRRFRNKTGKALGGEILRLRLERVRNQLGTGSDKLEKLARENGLCHASYLIKAFKRRFGVTPAAFRRRQAAGRKAPKSGG